MSDTTAALSFHAADDGQWHEFTALATRSYGHSVPDLPRLRGHADARVAVRDGRVVAGGLGLLVHQFFGGQPVASACLVGGCVAPEERGRRLAGAMAAERLRPLQEQGAVLATVWTASTGYVRRLGWQAPTDVIAWSVPTTELARAAEQANERDAADFQIIHGISTEARQMQQELAKLWNGPWQRPTWWDSWQQDAHPTLATYSFALPGRGPQGLLSLAVENTPTEGRHLVVHDFWAVDNRAAAAMLEFLARHGSRIPTVVFQRTGLPPAPLLLHTLHRAGAVTARSWHPWMLRVLDLEQAVRLRGWPLELDLTLPIEVADPDHSAERFTLRITAGKGDLAPSSRVGEVSLTRAQFAAWYAGGYRSATAATLAGVRGSPRSVARLVGAAAEHAPWLSEYF